MHVPTATDPPKEVMTFFLFFKYQIGLHSKHLQKSEVDRTRTTNLRAEDAELEIGYQVLSGGTAIRECSQKRVMVVTYSISSRFFIANINRLSTMSHSLFPVLPN